MAGVVLLAPCAAAQAFLLDPGESSFRVGGGLSWANSLPAGVSGAEVGVTLDFLDLSAAFGFFPEDAAWSPDDSFAIGVGATPYRDAAGVSFGAFVVAQRTSYSGGQQSWELTLPEGASRALTVGLTGALPLVSEERSRLLLAFRPFLISGTPASRSSYGGPRETRSELGWTLALPARADLPGSFSLAAEPSLTWTNGGSWVRGMSVSAMTRGRIRTKARPVTVSP